LLVAPDAVTFQRPVAALASLTFARNVPAAFARTVVVKDLRPLPLPPLMLSFTFSPGLNRSPLTVIFLPLATFARSVATFAATGLTCSGAVADFVPLVTRTCELPGAANSGTRTVPLSIPASSIRSVPTVTPPIDTVAASLPVGADERRCRPVRRTAPPWRATSRSRTSSARAFVS